MNKKGFTLIELLATITILSIISIISFVAINAVIEKSKIKNCQSLRKSIETAAKEYISEYRYSANENNSNYTSDDEDGTSADSGKKKTKYVNSKGMVPGQIFRITAKELIDENMLTGPLVSPFDDKEIDPEYVGISASIKSNYTPGIITLYINAPDGGLSNEDFTRLNDLMTCRIDEQINIDETPNNG